ncbi:molybdenum cofactor guanylyltransferase [Paenibacillus polygoni]|uniref:Probable molybdenum cofactor guanylyltransferase n=1 Tax=Paenibacillus polygoni TaxID=3050112 RepID=A0ABY8X1S9_9BACL|nr:molybdenum cofactor guanylyltransferase [Paenibacillus polygoni]WIV18973.1 molybdenum cofactor guanylyltransferase [Paenibacillus polygoni]
MKIAGIVLAGGASRRMGTDKAALELGNSRVLDIIAGELSSMTAQVYIATGSVSREHMDSEYIEVKDIYPGSGPLAGMQAGMLRGEADLYVVVSCDIPLIRAELLSAMVKVLELSLDSGIQALVPQIRGQIHPLAAVYHCSIIDVLEAQLREDNRRVRDALSRLSVRYVTESELELVTGIPAAQIEEMFINMNEKEDYERVKQIYESRDVE